MSIDKEAFQVMADKTGLAGDAYIATFNIISLYEDAKAPRQEVDLEALFRAFAKSIEGTANAALFPYHAPGTIKIPEEELLYWIAYLPISLQTEKPKTNQMGDRE